jgi:hypothetical protein
VIPRPQAECSFPFPTTAQVTTAQVTTARATPCPARWAGTATRRAATRVARFATLLRRAPARWAGSWRALSAALAPSSAPAEQTRLPWWALALPVLAFTVLLVVARPGAGSAGDAGAGVLAPFGHAVRVLGATLRYAL